MGDRPVLLLWRPVGAGLGTTVIRCRTNRWTGAVRTPTYPLDKSHHASPGASALVQRTKGLIFCPRIGLHGGGDLRAGGGVAARLGPPHPCRPAAGLDRRNGLPARLGGDAALGAHGAGGTPLKACRFGRLAAQLPLRSGRKDTALRP